MKTELPNQQLLSRFLLFLCTTFVLFGLCVAHEPMQSDRIDLNIPQGDAEVTLREFALQSFKSILFDLEEVEGISTNQILGSYTPNEALEVMLQGTSLGFIQDIDAGAFAIMRLAPEEPELSAEPTGGHPDGSDNENTNQHNSNKMNKRKSTVSKLLGGLMGLIVAGSGVPLDAQDAEQPEDESIYELSPFEVSTSSDMGYLATSTLAGTRLNTDLRDVGSAVSVVTKEFLEDTGAVDNETLLMYTTNTEVGGVHTSYAGASLGQVTTEGSYFARPNSNTRVRGLDAADNTRDFFLTDIPWDGYNIERVDLQRGPNSILFGLGSPAGIINTTTQAASFSDSSKVEMRFGSYNSVRGSINLNRVIIEDELAVRVAALKDHQYYRQNPAYEDDERGFAAFKYEPKYLKDRGLNLSIKGNIEGGSINSNRPRSLTPTDYISAWFRDVDDPLGGVGKRTYNPYTVQTVNADFPDWGGAIPATETGEANPSYVPILGSYGSEFGGPIAIYSNGNGTPDIFMIAEPDGSTGTGGIDSDGNYDGTVYAYNRMVGIGSYYEYARRAGLPFNEYGQYKNFTLTDSSIFDFYDQLIDGSNKAEWNNFHSYNLSGSLNFMDNMFGVEIAYDYQDFERGTFGGVNNTIYIDINENFGDYSANPNLGRPYVNTNHMYGNGYVTSVREAKRATAYADINVRDLVQEETWWVKLLGRHVFTALVSDDSNYEESRSFAEYDSSDEYGLYTGDNEEITSNLRAINSYLYLGDSLLGASSATGANIPNPNGSYSVPSGAYRMFDASWTATGVNPSDPFTTPYGSELTQADNPANYAGWFDYPMTVLSAKDKTVRDLLTYDATKDFERVRSTAFVWQGYLWDHSIVATAGWRRDHAKAWLTDADKNVHRRAIMDDSYIFSEDPQNNVKSESRSYSIAWHATEFLEDWVQLPVNISLYYNRSTNFQPAAGRVDLLNNPIGAPNGKTVDKSVLISTKDNKYSLKITKYENSVNLASGSAYNQAWMLGSIEAWTGIYANVFEYDLGGFTFDTANTGVESRYNYVAATGETAEQAAAREDAAVTAWRVHQNNIRTEFPGFYDLWLDRDPSEDGWINSSAPAGFTLTEDTVSTGYEFEFVANPTNNWRISMNASKVEAVRNNVGGELMSRFMDLMIHDLTNTPAGDVRIWWGAAGSPTAQSTFAGAASEWELVKLKEGTAADEIREWKFSLVTNYQFSEGRFKGVNVGGSYRWEDDIIIGYPLMDGSNGLTTYDLDNPYKGPSNGYFDFWIGYSKELKGGIDWKIQANVRNAFADDTLIPLTTQPDGTPAAMRIPPNTTWTITNTFSF